MHLLSSWTRSIEQGGCQQLVGTFKLYLNIVYSIGVLNLLTLVEPEVSTKCFYICCGSLI